MKQVFVAQHPTEAHLVKGMLEANGIVAEVHGESLFSARGEAPATPDTLPTVWVLDDEQATTARSVLAEYAAPAASGVSQRAAWLCPACGEVIEAQFTECWNCGASVNTPQE
jgi:ribosomal protein S27AE